MPIECEVVLEQQHKYVEIAPEVKRLHEQGVTIEALAVTYKADPGWRDANLGPVKTMPRAKAHGNFCQSPPRTQVQAACRAGRQAA